MEKLANDNAKLFNINNHEFKILKGNSHDNIIIKTVKEYFPNGIDLLFIDGDHSYNGVKSDFINYFPLVNSGGFIIFDDYLPRKNNPAVKAIDEIKRTYNNKIIDIGLVNDILEVYKLKPLTCSPTFNIEGKYVSYIIQKQ